MNPERTAEQIRDSLSGVSELYNRLLLVVGPTGSGKTSALRAFSQQRGYPVVNLGVELSRRLLDLTERQRTIELPSLLTGLIEESKHDVIVLDNTEILFNPELKQDPLRLLLGLSRNRTVVASWLGVLDSQSLTYATPDLFDGLYREVILDPTSVTTSVDSVLAKVRAQAEAMQGNTTLLAQTAALTPNEAQRLLGHPLPYWVERMTVNFLSIGGGEADKGKAGWRLKWPDGYAIPSAVFTISDAERLPAAEHLTLEEPRVRDIAKRIPRFLPQQPIPCLELRGISSEIFGAWSLWTVAIRGALLNRERVLPLFLHDDGRVLQPTARHIWNLLLEQCPPPVRFLDSQEAGLLYSAVSLAVEQHGRPVYEELIHCHGRSLRREKENRQYAFEVRRRAIENVGLHAVRHHRHEELVEEESKWNQEFESRSNVQPELIPRLILRVEGAGAND